MWLKKQKRKERNVSVDQVSVSNSRISASNSGFLDGDQTTYLTRQK